ncbi:triphosphoribosyl-dephospho-CoA synthase CitG [Pectobacterium parmentieri]|uniref:Probable 2-(5''-triphosphoribosyl)-3'-dephosphocoenzyme-A synthase n=1 Tax=Pectobacterium parmentieri TaxID=1905730 RepID=A0A8B3FCC6_PECPM|nr:triphosphoribosyl-dephospho-CoA synthase CitG [Pectobacterium parmentieri]AOR58987.1 triphosphoribosyl-dephospho-CoA synthase CitG [Pectobacterium parmentieri]AYH09983.1 triphosphoribosyl-dephospho-CoA synthase CitG [Pectobacterium parmentieri]AYH19306.1 triphosphoribosyl-dephospho-CoA synthase CitG [Pectobacterium parmentieri]AYH36302.1 triphosphoribosyl-dephospho-CoA synthase CitG [Pectobacterium parmentieri]AZS56407.1 triphosphoribosyl-dephospho-CoA synthase CitG [Pectobacterium parmenti
MPTLRQSDSVLPTTASHSAQREYRERHPLPDIGQRVARALTMEVMLTPKPGLVDSANNGSHRDMDVALFQTSIQAISSWFRYFTDAGYQHACVPLVQLLSQVRPIGIACEQAMLSATKGVNTHKGGIFAFGLLCTAAGWLAGRGERVTQRSLCNSVAVMCSDLVRNELETCSGAATAGEHLYQRHGLTGARGEAASGFNTVCQYALPTLRQAIADGADEDTALLRTLLVLMAYNPDTNVVSRGGMDGLVFVQHYAQRLLADPLDRQALIMMDEALIARNLSPGGSADLLAVTWLLYHYPAE